jgi:DNA topoisomerase VI subunit B
LRRATFTTSRLLEFFKHEELMLQMGHQRHLWPIALLKEMIDNSLDAAEGTGVAPAVLVEVTDDTLCVHDNGPGLPDEVLEKSLDYTIRVSNKTNYVSPTRGQLGNALKCLWAAPYVAHGSRGLLEVEAHGACHRIEVTLDQIQQRPDLRHTAAPGSVKKGTLIRLHWPQIASCMLDDRGPDFYSVETLLDAYAAFNPHASFALRVRGNQSREWPCVDSTWPKWTPGRPTSPGWYSAERLRSLVTALVAEERRGGKPQTVRQFIGDFAGLSAPPSQKKVFEAADLPGDYLHDLVRGGEVDPDAVGRLLCAMQGASRAIQPKALGILGEKHLSESLVRYHGVHPDSVRYRKGLPKKGCSGLPFVVEVAFGVMSQDVASSQVTAGINWSPALRVPFPELSVHLGEMRVDEEDPVAMLVHLALPRAEYTDRGKSRLAMPAGVRDALAACVRSAAKGWKEAKRQADRNGRVRELELERQRKANRPQVLSVRDAAFRVMEAAYLETSDNNQLPAHARQVMYKARPGTQALTGGKCWKKSSYFTQKLLPEFMERHPGLTADWDVVFDARGHLREPHTGRNVGLGTLQVREYVRDWRLDINEAVAWRPMAHDCPTVGPGNRYRFALFIEKEGFDAHLARARIAERFDVAIMSTKGMSVTAARQLIERLSEKGVTVLVLHDFDKSGFTIVHTLSHDTRRFKFRTRPRVIGLGLRLADVSQMNLESEQVDYDCKKDPRENLRGCGATEEECDFLVRRRLSEGWTGCRVELNAMTSRQFIDFVERKLTAAGVRKLTPGRDTLEKAYRRAWRIAEVNDAVSRALADDKAEGIVPAIPEDLEDDVRRRIDGGAQPWDDALWQIVQETRGRRKASTLSPDRPV